MPTQFDSFDVDLHDVDVTRSLLPEGNYTLGVTKVGRSTYTVKETRKDGTVNPDAGQERSFFYARFTVFDHETEAGRGFNMTFFPSKYTAMVWRKLMDGTLVDQNPNEGIVEYAERLADADTPALFKGEVIHEENTFRLGEDGQPEKEEKLNAWSITSLS